MPDVCNGFGFPIWFWAKLTSAIEAWRRLILLAAGTHCWGGGGLVQTLIRRLEEGKAELIPRYSFAWME